MGRENISAKFTRPADTTAYASGDLIANSTTNSSVTAMSFAVAPGAIQVRRVRIARSKADITTAAVRLHLYAALPTVANGDNAAWSSTQAATHLGAVDVTFASLMSDGATGQATTEINFNSSGSVIYGLLEARSALAPASAEVFAVTLEIC